MAALGFPVPLPLPRASLATVSAPWSILDDDADGWSNGTEFDYHFTDPWEAVLQAIEDDTGFTGTVGDMKFGERPWADFQRLTHGDSVASANFSVSAKLEEGGFPRVEWTEIWLQAASPHFSHPSALERVQSGSSL